MPVEVKCSFGRWAVGTARRPHFLAGLLTEESERSSGASGQKDPPALLGKGTLLPGAGLTQTLQTELGQAEESHLQPRRQEK